MVHGVQTQQKANEQWCAVVFLWCIGSDSTTANDREVTLKIISTISYLSKFNVSESAVHIS